MDEENFSEHDLSGQESIVLPPAAKPGAFQIIFSISFVLFVVVLALELIGRKNPEFPYTAESIMA